MATITYGPGGEPCLLQEKRFRSNFVLRSTRACALCCTEVATDGACSAGELCDRVNNPVPPEMILTNIAMPMPMFVSRLTSQQYHERKSPALARSFSQTFGKTGYARLSSDSPRLNAFWRVAPSVLFNFLAIRPAGVFLRASVFSSRTCTDVHAFLFDPFFMRISMYESRCL